MKSVPISAAMICAAAVFPPPEADEEGVVELPVVLLGAVERHDDLVLHGRLADQVIHRRGPSLVDVRGALIAHGVFLPYAAIGAVTPSLWTQRRAFSCPPGYNHAGFGPTRAGPKPSPTTTRCPDRTRRSKPSKSSSSWRSRI